MALIQFTKNHNDHSTEKGYQFEFLCDRCGNGFMTEFKPSVTGIAAGALRAAGSLLGGIFGGAGSASHELVDAVRGPARDAAFREAVGEAKPHFHQCPKCATWVCETCWNKKRSLCFECAPDIDTELASAQVQATVEQLKDKVRQQDLTKDLDLTSEAVARCPSCGAQAQGGKFCPECGKPLRPKAECSKCGTKVEAGSKFCPECGTKV
jgi:membrane protease subunit (stomatin/prohibitin family)